MMIQTIAVALVVGTVLALAIVLSTPPLRRWLDDRRANEAIRSRVVATDSAFEAEKKRLADLEEKRLADRKAELAAAETRIAEREDQISLNLGKLTAAQREHIEAAAELAKQEAALEERERSLEQSRTDAERAAAEAAARLEAREEALAAQEAGLEQQDGDPADEERSAEDRDLIWWEKQLGRSLPAKK